MIDRRIWLVVIANFAVVTAALFYGAVTKASLVSTILVVSIAATGGLMARVFSQRAKTMQSELVAGEVRPHKYRDLVWTGGGFVAGALLLGAAKALQFVPEEWVGGDYLIEAGFFCAGCYFVWLGLRGART